MKHYFVLILFVFLNLFCFNCSTPKKAHCGIEKSNIANTLNKVANWQIHNFSYSTTKNLHDKGISSWTNATFYLGLVQWAKTRANDSTYLKWLTTIGQETSWKVPSNFKDISKYQLYHADEFCIAQMYLEMYTIYKDQDMLASAQDRANWVLNHPGNASMQHSNKQSWTWCDALFMAPQVYAYLFLIEGDEKYLRFMDQEFKRTFNYLYSTNDNLFFRDDSYFNKTENNGEKIFWGRGNGWVAAGLVNILKLLPKDSSYRAFYENLFKEFVAKLASLQNENGFWHASLLDTLSYPAPETSATALITYALAYGINTNLLDKQKYCPILSNAWQALLSVVDQNGKLGWVQPIGADPKKVTLEMTATYGVGAFLLAGSEIYQLVQNQSL